MRSDRSFAARENSRLLGRSIVIGIRSLFLSVVLVAAASSHFGATYTGTNTGAIPDGSNPNRVCGAPRDVQFSVSSFPGGFGSGSVSFTMSPQHSYIGDLRVSLIAPDATEHLLFDRVGATSATDFGDSSNLEGTYTFNDLATLNIWTVAASGNTNYELTNGAYRTQAAGPAANTSPGPAFTSLNTTFAPMNPANINGTWTLRFLDCAGGDTGTVSAASLTLNPTLSAEVSLGGRIMTRHGAGLRNAIVTVSGGTLTEPRSVATGTFGYYNFEGLDAGQTYVVSVSARRYTFSTPAMLVTLDDSLDSVNFVSNQ